jgi:hypothetical protein
MQDIVFSKHAIARACQIGLPIQKLRSIFLQAKYNTPCVKRELYKLSKYGEKQNSISYWTTRKLIFTVKEEGDKQVIITITSKNKPVKRVIKTLGEDIYVQSKSSIR